MMPEDPVDEKRMEEALRLAQRAAEAGLPRRSL
jgi:hypothetical protein